uniref:hypothetical protein n=1 Tax=Dietzia sp. SYD-A1 TaxID=2780141 RepID=UPI001E3DE9DE
MTTISRRTVPLIVAALLIVVAGLAGCGSGPQAHAVTIGDCTIEPGAVTYAAGVRQNTPAPVIGGDLADIAGQAAVTGHSVSVVSVEGRPAVLYDAAPAPVPSSGKQKSKLMDRTKITVNTVLATQTATTEQADPLAALALAARTLRARASTGVGTVVLLDSGLSTVAPLD